MARTARDIFEFKLKTIAYAQSEFKDGKGPGGTVGISYATRALGIADKAHPLKHTSSLLNPLQSCRGLFKLLSNPRHRLYTPSLLRLMSSGRMCSHS